MLSWVVLLAEESKVTDGSRINTDLISSFHSGHNTHLSVIIGVNR